MWVDTSDDRAHEIAFQEVMKELKQLNSPGDVQKALWKYRPAYEAAKVAEQPVDHTQAWGKWINDGRSRDFYGSYSHQQAFQGGWNARVPER